MILICDFRSNIAYIRFREKTEEVETIPISDEMNIDIAPDGSVYGIELLNANEQLQSKEMGKLLVVDEATGEHTEVSLPKAS